MALSVDELIEKAKEQRGRKRYEEALVSALAAVEQDDQNGQAWWQVALSRQILGDTARTIVALRRTVDLIPDASNAWAKLGDLLMKDGESDEAKDSFETALIYDPEQITALEGLSSIYADEDDEDQDDKEISVLERIERLSSLSAFQINRFGILHYRNGRNFEAIRCWKMDIWTAGHPSQRFNLGLAYNNDSLSQDADAIDMWRLVLRDWPDHEPAKKSIARVLPRLLDLAERARRKGATILPEEQHFDHYMNPFQLLNPPEDTDIEDLDAKTIQRLKKAMLQEIELEDGNLSWMPGIVIEKSRAIGLCDELHDDNKKLWHWLVFSNKPLLDFLTKGAPEHFLVSADKSELDTLDRIEWDDDFLEWLGKLFAPQFDRVLTKAIDQGDAVLVECLLDGRRWVPTSMVDDCFRNAQRAVERLLEPLNELWEGADVFKPSVIGIEEILQYGRLLEIMNLLPAFFEKQQNDAVHSIRGIAIKAFNVHDDVDLSRKIIEQAQRFKFRSADANRTIEEDVKTIEDLVRKERKHEAKLTRGGKQRWEITKEGILMGDRFIAAADVSSIRWGTIITGQRSAPGYDYLFAAGDDHGREIIFQWKASNDFERNQDYFKQLITAALNYVFPKLIERTEARLATGQPMSIGTCRLTSDGVNFQVAGWLFTKDHFVPWDRVMSSLENGEVSIFDTNYPKKRTTFSFRDTDNAPLLRALVNIKNGRDD